MAARCRRSDHRHAGSFLIRPSTPLLPSGERPHGHNVATWSTIELREQGLALPDHVRMAPGARAIDLGCGPFGILDMLAERLGLSWAADGRDDAATSTRALE